MFFSFIPSGYFVFLDESFGRVERFDGSNLSLDDCLVELLLDVFARREMLSFHVYFWILTFYFVINTKLHFAQHAGFRCRGLPMSDEALQRRTLMWIDIKPMVSARHFHTILSDNAVHDVLL